MGGVARRANAASRGRWPGVYGCAFQKFCRPVYYIYQLVRAGLFPRFFSPSFLPSPLCSPFFIFISPFKLDNLLNMYYNPLNPGLDLRLFKITPSRFLSSNRIFSALRCPFLCRPSLHPRPTWLNHIEIWRVGAPS